MGDRATEPALQIARASDAVDRNDLDRALAVLRQLPSTPRLETAIAHLRWLRGESVDRELVVVPSDTTATARALFDLEAALARYAKRAANAR